MSQIQDLSNSKFHFVFVFIMLSLGTLQTNNNIQEIYMKMIEMQQNKIKNHYSLKEFENNETIDLENSLPEAQISSPKISLEDSSQKLLDCSVDKYFNF